jgi:glutaconate CoA-transferase subunit B
VVIAPHSRRTFVEQLDFRTTVGYGDGPGARERLRFRGRGPTAVITDLGVLEPDPQSERLELIQLHPGVSVEQVREATGWPLSVREAPSVTPAPTDDELAALRELVAR